MSVVLAPGYQSNSDKEQRKAGDQFPADPLAQDNVAEDCDEQHLQIQDHSRKTCPPDRMNRLVPEHQIDSEERAGK